MEDKKHLSHAQCIKVILEKYDDLLEEHDNASAILTFPPRRVSTYVRALFSHREFLLRSSNPTLKK